MQDQASAPSPSLKPPACPASTLDGQLVCARCCWLQLPLLCTSAQVRCCAGSSRANWTGCRMRRPWPACCSSRPRWPALRLSLRSRGWRSRAWSACWRPPPHPAPRVGLLGACWAPPGRSSIMRLPTARTCRARPLCAIRRQCTALRCQLAHGAGAHGSGWRRRGPRTGSAGGVCRRGEALLLSTLQQAALPGLAGSRTRCSHGAQGGSVLGDTLGC